MASRGVISTALPFSAIAPPRRIENSDPGMPIEFCNEKLYFLALDDRNGTRSDQLALCRLDVHDTDLGRDILGRLPKCGAKRRIGLGDHDWQPGVAAQPDLCVERNLADERHPHTLRHAPGPAVVK